MESSRDAVVNSSGGITVVGADDPSNYHVAARSENHAPMAAAAAVSQSISLDLSTVPAMSEQMKKKKRGRPRKYGPDGMALAISPKPISSAAPHPPVIDFSAPKRGKIRPPGSGIKFNKMNSEISGLDFYVV